MAVSMQEDKEWPWLELWTHVTSEIHDEQSHQDQMEQQTVRLVQHHHHHHRPQQQEGAEEHTHHFEIPMNALPF